MAIAYTDLTKQQRKDAKETTTTKTKRNNNKTQKEQQQQYKRNMGKNPAPSEENCYLQSVLDHFSECQKGPTWDS